MNGSKRERQRMKDLRCANLHGKHRERARKKWSSREAFASVEVERTRTVNKEGRENGFPLEQSLGKTTSGCIQTTQRIFAHSYVSFSARRQRGKGYRVNRLIEKRRFNRSHLSDRRHGRQQKPTDTFEDNGHNYKPDVMSTSVISR